jgi:hypothetical protein
MLPLLLLPLLLLPLPLLLIMMMSVQNEIGFLLPLIQDPVRQVQLNRGRLDARGCDGGSTGRPRGAPGRKSPARANRMGERLPRHHIAAAVAARRTGPYPSPLADRGLLIGRRLAFLSPPHGRAASTRSGLRNDHATTLGQVVGVGTETRVLDSPAALHYSAAEARAREMIR